MVYNNCALYMLLYKQCRGFYCCSKRVVNARSVFQEHHLVLTTVGEATALFSNNIRFCMLPVKGVSIVKHVTPPHGNDNGRSIPDASERTAIVALPTAASPGYQAFKKLHLNSKTFLRSIKDEPAF